jgi:hypothetical protein
VFFYHIAAKVNSKSCIWYGELLVVVLSSLVPLGLLAWVILPSSALGSFGGSLAVFWVHLHPWSSSVSFLRLAVFFGFGIVLLGS